MAVAVAVALLLLSTMASILAQSAPAVDAADAADQQRELNAMFQRALAKAREMAVDMDADRASPAAQRQRRLNERDSSGSYKPVPTWDKDSCEARSFTDITTQVRESHATLNDGKRARVLVTGAAGFIASHVADYCAKYCSVLRPLRSMI